MGPTAPARVEGDIWSLAADGWIVVPTNIGYKATGHNVMGRGIASQAAAKFPEVPAWYGSWCRQHKQFTPVVAHEFVNKETKQHARLIFLPTKELNVAAPHLSWQNTSSLRLIERGCEQMLLWVLWENNVGLPVYVPMLGCGNGGLKQEAVAPVLDSILSYSKDFRIVEALQED